MAWACPPPGSPLFYFCQPISRVTVLVFLLVLVAIDDENCFTFKWLWRRSSIGQGHQAENTNRNNSLSHWFDSIFLGKFSSLVENTDKKLAPAVQFVGIFVGIGKLNDRGEFRYSERRNRADGPQERWRGRQPKADLIDVDCRAARPKFDMGDGPLALFGSRTKLMQHWADRIDHWLDPKKAMPIKGGAQA